ncbi:MAG: 16S rRNA (guanine(527)-N(7))-methyltransferase RsmG [Alphaproteobacteria bacterium]|nr:MAG: 16S rRNA (guanine(527)-N(7))-methyltransferase RsmG [Alphaproteobacteria bacterium]
MSAKCAGRPYGPADLARDVAVSREILARLHAHAAVLQAWQPRLNLVGRSTLGDLWRRHMLDSAQLFPLLPGDPAALALLDMGAGAGFPGLVLAAMGAGHVHLVESDARKAAFLRAAVRAMGLGGAVSVHQTRLQDLAPWPVDVVTARALAPLDSLLRWSHPFAQPGTLWIFPKGRSVERELTAARACWKMRAVLRPSLSDASGRILLISEVEPHGR